jgi:hypothetical protein
MRRWPALSLVLAALVAAGAMLGNGATAAQRDGEIGIEAIRDIFPNPTRIVINGAGPAEPYPSTINISNLPKRLYDVNVILRGLRHGRPDDIDIMLLAPNGARAVIMADAGGATAVSGITLTLDDEAANPLPDSGELRTASYKPRNHAGADTFGTDNVLLGTFDGINPNGAWHLYVRDDRSDFKGEITSGWALEILYGEAPVAHDDHYTTRQDRRLEVSARNGVLANDTDGDPEPGVESDLEAILDRGPRKGTLRLRADGSFVYKPEAGRRGEDDFIYIVRDRDGLTDRGLVTIEIQR